MDFQQLHILPSSLLDDYHRAVTFDPLFGIERLEDFEMSVDYFKFYKSVSSVYSSKIEGEDIDFDSFFKHKFLNVPFQPDYTKKADDLLEAYEFIEEHELSLENVRKAHAILSKNLLPKSQQGLIRTNPMFVMNSEDKIEYVAAPPTIIKAELSRLFKDIQYLTSSTLSVKEIFYFASLIHLVFVKIHPFQDGNGRTARLIEKWFLHTKLGDIATGISLEKNYYINLSGYYSNIRVIGLEYEELDYSKALDFLLMTVNGLRKS